MPTRKRFLSTALGATAVYAASRAQADPAPNASPTPQPGGLTKPGTLAKELAASLQRQLKNAKLSESLTAEIASNIQDGLAISAAFANRKTGDLPPPDFVFVAEATERP